MTVAQLGAGDTFLTIHPLALGVLWEDRAVERTVDDGSGTAAAGRFETAVGAAAGGAATSRKHADGSAGMSRRGCFFTGQEDYALASKQETWRDQPQKQETEERDQTTVLAGLTMSEQALAPTGASAMRYDS
ncbi:hypothetical protein J7T55_007050 [Diaporthe amygdali]|uniref:uncharacterized protein n=1 Tax=Phomopsis amygdali TaxID=1214568 RepID=UPI0022FE7FA3|nr:uncharacterized protein J7T55_007050 [Diaporthe amygdali]KAJ0107839.1 hypothetical protein J7T55_007050 [Diaporthe amygdali]